MKATKVATIPPIKGREAPPDPGPIMPQKPIKENIETVPLHFETESLQIRRPAIPRRVKSSFSKLRPIKPQEGSYALRFEDFTWAHTDLDTTDHVAHRRELLDITKNYDQVMKTITEPTDLAQAASYQAAADLLLENIVSQLRVECLEQSELVVRARDSYAEIFRLLQRDALKNRQRILELERNNVNLEESLTKVVENATQRVKEAQDTCQLQLANLRKEMDEKKEEYDTSMKRFLEQKSQLQEHVKALHRVFLDFQSDSVYITLEDLKQKLERMEKKLSQKDNEILKMNFDNTKLRKQIQDMEDGKLVLEQANDELRRKLRTSMAQINRLERSLALARLEGLHPDDEAEPEDGSASPSSRLDLPDKHLMSAITAQASTEGSPFRRRQVSKILDPGPYVLIYQKLTRIHDRLTDFVQSNCPMPPVALSDSDADESHKIFLSGEARLILNCLNAKVDELARYADVLETATASNQQQGTKLPANVPRFLRYIHGHIPDTEVRTRFSPFSFIRGLFQSKHVSDQWRRRQNRPELRFPEFVVAWHCKDGENLFAALQRCSRLWRAAKASKLPEIRLFRKFVTEKFTSDELKFFLELRMGLVGNTVSEDEVLMIPYKQCRLVLETILGSFSPIIQVISGEADRCVKNGMIDYAEFSMVMLKFYQTERRKRRNAVRLMFQSRRFFAGQDRIYFENCVAMIQTLSFQGLIKNSFDLFRESSVLSGGEVSLDGLLISMDNLSFHFYSIEIPTPWAKPDEGTTISRLVLENHWRTFMSWFEGFNDVKDKLDTWLVSKITSQVRLVDKLFQARAPPNTLYDAYRELLDSFQFMLNVMAKGQQEPMPDQKAERQLQIIEALIDLLITFVVPQEGDKVTFTEFE
jgi:hypothetical protein